MKEETGARQSPHPSKQQIPAPDVSELVTDRHRALVLRQRRYRVFGKQTVGRSRPATNGVLTRAATRTSGVIVRPSCRAMRSAIAASSAPTRVDSRSVRRSVARPQSKRTALYQHAREPHSHSGDHPHANRRYAGVARHALDEDTRAATSSDEERSPRE
jgi:arginyl-tRNA--protein-N-Asp/Glu arginylyltransferase